MKTPQEWMNQFTGLHEPILVTVNQMAIRDIQLDAFKAGAEWAAKQIDEEAQTMPSMVSECAMLDVKTKILFTLSSLKEIPK